MPGDGDLRALRSPPQGALAGMLKRVIVGKRKRPSGAANYRPSSSRPQQPLSGHSSAEERGVRGPIKAFMRGLWKVSWRSFDPLKLLVPYTFLHS